VYVLYTFTNIGMRWSPGSTPAASTEAPHDLAVVGGFVVGASEEAAGVRGCRDATDAQWRQKAPLRNPVGFVPSGLMSFCALQRA